MSSVRDHPLPCRGGRLVASVALLLCSWSVVAAEAARPEIFVLPLERATLGDDLVVRVQIDGIAKIEAVTLWAIGDGDALYRAIGMEPFSGGRYEARMAARPDGGAWRAYYVEAASAGSGRWSNGSAESPFPVRVAARRGGTGSGGVTRSWWIVALLVLAPLALVWRVYFRRARGDGDRAFWIELLGPVSHLEGADLRSAVHAACILPREHPDRGLIQVDPEKALSKLQTLMDSDADRLAVARQRQQERERAAAGPAPERVEEDLFWFRTLSPLVDRPPQEAERALRELGSRVLMHPVEGRRLFDLPRLRAELRRVSRMDASELTARAEAARPLPVEEAALPVGAVAGETVHRSAGMSLVELLAALGLMAVVLGIGALWLQPMETPVRTGGETLMALVEQTRARAISTTQVHRVRPLSESELIVEYADSCSAGAWTLDPAIRLDLPRRVVLQDSAWSVCFDERGVTSQSLFVMLEHPEHGTAELELLRGGAIRWRP